MTKLKLLALIALASLAVPASAGRKSAATGVVINQSGRSASGALGAVHNSSSSYESIYCSVSSFETWTGISCAAVNSSNVFSSCNIANPPQGMLAALATATSDSNLSFSWSSTYKCTNITVWTGSDSVAKIPPASQTVIGGIY